MVRTNSWGGEEMRNMEEEVEKSKIREGRKNNRKKKTNGEREIKEGTVGKKVRSSKVKSRKK